jgi:hypothetical protein
MSKLISRRTLVSRMVQISFGGALVSAVAVAAPDKLCADPEAMDSGQRSLRASLNYVEASSEPSKTCSGCSFFQSPNDGCGTCMIFSGPANAKGHCDSWSTKT